MHAKRRLGKVITRGNEMNLLSLSLFHLVLPFARNFSSRDDLQLCNLNQSHRGGDSERKKMKAVGTFDFLFALAVKAATLRKDIESSRT